MRGNAYAQTKKYREAALDYRKALTIDPNNDEAKKNLAVINQL
jgi:Flp pilus assembly protein TadD